MTYHVVVEPVPSARAALAIWLLNQDPGIRTASPTGFHVPTDMFLSLPEELLEGALVDGNVYRSVIEGFEPLGRDGYRPADVVPVDDGAQPEPLKPRRARKRVSQHPTGAAVTAESRQVPTGKAAEK